MGQNFSGNNTAYIFFLDGFIFFYVLWLVYKSVFYAKQFFSPEIQQNSVYTVTVQNK
jgi:hypothetical protein